MYKLIAFTVLLAVATAAPAPEPKPYAPVVSVHPVVPVVASHSSVVHSSVVHPVPVYHPAPVVVKSAYMKPVYPIVAPVQVVHAPTVYYH